MLDQALEGIRVLDLTHHIAGPWCTKLLADYGADVIKVERPWGGDPARDLGPFHQDDPHHERSGLFLHLNTNKRSVTLNLKVPSGQVILKELVKEADILVESFSPRVMPSLGLNYAVLSEINSKLVMTSISNFGQTGPYRDYKASELVLFGMGGEMHSIGIEGREPLKEGGNVVQYEAGAVAADTSLAALLASERDGVGEHIDISIMETQLGGVDRRHAVLLAYQYAGMLSLQQVGWGAGFASGTFPCKDGYVEIAGGGPLFPRVIKMLGEPEFLQDPKWTAPGASADPQLREEFDPFFLSWLLERTKRQVWEAGQKARVLCGPLYTTEDLLSDPHFSARDFWTEVEHPFTGAIRYPGAPFRMSETPRQARRPAPLLGEHNEEVYGHIGYSRDDLVRLRERGVI
ncbi:MAG: CaiB/BaiF CoA transferase family protein [Dehalococcoidia bacterium]